MEYLNNEDQVYLFGADYVRDEEEDLKGTKIPICKYSVEPSTKYLITNAKTVEKCSTEEESHKKWMDVLFLYESFDFIYDEEEKK